MAKGKSKKYEGLLLEKRSAWDQLKKGEKAEVFNFAEEYKKFLDIARTERLSVQEIIRIALLHGFKIVEKNSDNIEDKGDKLIFTNRGKNVALVYRGSEPMQNGVNTIFSHIDSPCLHLKQVTVLEDGDSGTVVFKIHYYGGIKKYQWVARPMALFGVIVKKNGEIINVSIGKDKQDPVFVIPDLLPHLADKAQELSPGTKIEDVIPAEKLNALMGSMPIEDKKAEERIKTNVLDILNKKYGIVEEDLISSELMFVPADDVRDLGVDRSMIIGYGHDDKSCAYDSMEALLHIADMNKQLEKTSAIFFFDKEEIGSEGDTSANANFLEYVLASLQGDVSIKKNLEMLRNSRAISADVGAGVNPNWPEPHEMMNAAKVGYGLCVTKFTGSGGKYSTNDASAETVGYVRRILNENKIAWQTEELGKVDEGSGGTIAMIFARRGMKVIDVGLPVLSMHAPSEEVSKVDLWMLYRFYKAFLLEG